MPWLLEARAFPLLPLIRISRMTYEQTAVGG